MKKLSFIGAGNITRAMIRGCITSRQYDHGEIEVTDCSEEQKKSVQKQLGVCVVDNNKEIALKSEVLFLCVKPHQLIEVAEEIKPHLPKNSIVISVAAGKSLQLLQESLAEGQSAVRIVPNLASRVCKGTICLYAPPHTDPSILNELKILFELLGQVFFVDNEKLMAAITALSGSAPAYYVMMAEALIKYGCSEGLEPELAKKMILSTMEGSAAWAANAKIPLDDLWRKVVTPGGTTEAGINYYNEKGFVDTFIEGLNRATKRAQEMGDK